MDRIELIMIITHNSLFFAYSKFRFRLTGFIINQHFFYESRRYTQFPLLGFNFIGCKVYRDIKQNGIAVNLFKNDQQRLQQ